MFDGQILKFKDGSRLVREMAREVDRYVVGVDVGKSQDWTAISVVRQSTKALSTWTVRGNVLCQDSEEFLDLVALERLPLQTSYPEQVARVQQIASHPRVRGADVIVDATGVGAAVADMFDVLAPVRVTISGGAEAHRHARDRYSVPKADLVGAVLAALHSRQLRFGAGLALLEPLRQELQNFQLLARSSTGHETYGGRAGAHDDIVLSLSLAVWWARSAVKLKPRGEVGGYCLRAI